MGQLSMGSVLVDLEQFPVVVFRERRQVVRVEDFLGSFNALLARNEPFASVHDVRACDGWDSFDRSVVHQWLKQRTETLSKLVRGHCAIISSAEQRGMATAVFWDTKFAGKVRFFSDLPQARAWAQQRMVRSRRVA